MTVLPDSLPASGHAVGAIERELASGASVELAPRQIESAGCLADHLPPGTSVYVPFTPGAKRQDTVAACRRLHDQGMHAVPHLAARPLAGSGELDDWLGEFAGVGVAGVMLVAGDGRRPAGPYRDTLDLLESGKLAEHGIDRLGITAYPEGHPVAAAADLDAALAKKAAYAAATGAQMWIVTQFVFDPAPAITLMARLRSQDCQLPVRIGVAGPARPRTLLEFAVRCGVGTSVKMLRRQPNVTRLLNNWTPDGLLSALARHRADSGETSPAGIHLFTFGGLTKTATWLRSRRGVEDEPADVVDFPTADHRSS